MDTIFDVPTVDSVLEARSEIFSVLGNHSHARKLLQITSGEVEERKLLEVPLLLIGHLDSLVVTMSQGLSSESVPEVRAVQLASHLDSNLQIATLKGQIETGLRILDELQSNLGIALLLQVRNDAMTHHARGLDDLEHLIVIPLDQRQLELIFDGIDGKDSRLGITVEVVQAAALDAHEVDSLVEGANNAIVTLEANIDRLVWPLHEIDNCR